MYWAYVNQYGAVSVEATNGKLLGIKPGEYQCPSLEEAGWVKNERGWWHPPSCVAAWPLDEAWEMHIEALGDMLAQRPDDRANETPL
jgi:hypothetical protein